MRTQFASPFVVIACGGSPDPAVEQPVRPPVARPVEPATGPAVGTVRFVDPHCEQLAANREWTNVDCPDELLPLAGKDELVVSEDGKRCFLVYERKMGNRVSRYKWDEGRVRCPPGGPNVALPDPRRVTINGKRYELEPETLTCEVEMLGNPPSWRTVECPPQLVPRLVGIEPDAPCSYKGIKVNCGMDARILALLVVGSDVEITIGRGADDGLVKGMTVSLANTKGIRGTIISCNARTCKARLPTTADVVRASGGRVTIP